MSISNPQISVTELSIADIHARFAQGLLTCTELTQHLLQRIERYDKQGPCLNALLTVSPHALESARRKDREYDSNPTAVGPLHGIPVIVKDNYNTVDLPTTGGSVVLAHSRPPQDCFVVQQLRKAGALILAKANLTELAMGGTTVSSFGGQTRNPYDVLRTPGGSSGGTAAAIAANFGIIGTGSDTGQSIRSPASACNLVGIRPTRGLVSRSGILPISTTQDEAGPITRSVADAARMLDVIAVYDPDDPITAFGRRQKPRSYVSFLDRDGLRGARIGLLTDLLGTEGIHEEVNVAVHHAIQLMEQLGATVLRLSMPCLTTLTAELGVERFEFREAFNRYLTRLGPDAPVKNLTEFLADGRCHPGIKSRLEMYAAVEDDTRSAEYKNQWWRREALRQAVMTVLADNDLDAVLYPHQKRLVAGIVEGAIIRDLYTSLMQQEFRNRDGVIRPMGPENVLIVTPYNVQGTYLRSLLPAEARVGTVDLFQGQEAEVVLVSMVTSSGDDLPRNIEFLYSKHRLNVAISRARTLAVIVASPRLLDIACQTIEQMRLVNTLCWVKAYAE